MSKKSLTGLRAGNRAGDGMIPAGKCQFSKKVSGKRIIFDKRHQCEPACRWTDAECFEWLANTGYPSEWGKSLLSVLCVRCECGGLIGAPNDNGGRSVCHCEEAKVA
jgi:hypothetical protein